MSGDDANTVSLDAQGLSSSELNAAILETIADKVTVENTSEATYGFACGVRREIPIVAQGSIGDFAFLLGEAAAVDVEGDAGSWCGHSMASGSLVVHRSCADYFGAFATGGLIAVLGHAADRCGFRMSGADIFVRSTAGNEAGHGMCDGVMVIGNGAGKNLGYSMTGGTIYVRGDVESVAEGVRSFRMKDADTMRLSLLLARAGVKGGETREFKAYRPAKS